MATRIPFVDIYALQSDVDVNIIENLLSEGEIDFLIKKVRAENKKFDLEGTHEDKVISVEEDQAVDAVRIIVDAISEGVISDEGYFLEAE